VIMRAIEGESEHQNLTAVAYVRDQNPATRHPFQGKRRLFKGKAYNNQMTHPGSCECKLKIKFQLVAQP
jgi:hypothetical protein